MDTPQSDGAAVVEGFVSRSTRIDPPAFRAFLRDAAAPRTVWTAPGEATVVAEGAAATLTADGPGRFDRIRRAAESLFAGSDAGDAEDPARPRFFGGFAFHHEGCNRPPWQGFPGARFVLPMVQVAETEDGAWLTVNAVDPDASPDAVETRLRRERDRLASLDGPERDGPPGIVSRTRTTARDEWRVGVEAATGRINAGELRKVVLAQALEADLASQPSIPDLLARLGERYPDCYRFLVEPHDDATDSAAVARSGFLGATPERLVSLRGRTIETGGLAGTTGRGETPEEDEWLAEELLQSEKNLHEHELVVEAIRDQLAPLTTRVSTGERSIRKLATVQHLYTPITAELAGDEHVLSLVESLHPTPAVGGLPPDIALRTIRETEPFDRGWYAAPVGWFDAAGNGTFAVGIRSAVLDAETATLFAGVGVVGDSDPDSEWDEVQLKYRPMLDALEREH